MSDWTDKRKEEQDEVFDKRQEAQTDEEKEKAEEVVKEYLDRWNE